MTCWRPDLSPIEHVWYIIIEIGLSDLLHPAVNINSLRLGFRKFGMRFVPWGDIDLIESMQMSEQEIAEGSHILHFSFLWLLLIRVKIYMELVFSQRKNVMLLHFVYFERWYTKVSIYRVFLKIIWFFRN
jgi:hypothetical protein